MVNFLQKFAATLNAYTKKEVTKLSLGREEITILSKKYAREAYSACKTIVSSNSTFLLLDKPTFAVKRGRFEEGGFGRGGVGPILKAGVFPTEEIKLQSNCSEMNGCHHAH